MKKTVLITGASSGFGYEFVKLFAKGNYNLILTARNIERLEEIQNEFNSLNIALIKKDLSMPHSAKELFDEIKEKGFNIDVLINNAGFGLVGRFDRLDVDRQVDMIELNVSALTELTHYILQEMKQRGNGKILNVASTAAFRPGPLMAVYYASKAYLLSFSEAIAEELRGTGITVTALCPGPSKTNFAKAANVEKTKMFAKVMDADVVAKLGFKALMKGKRVVVTGNVNKLGTYAVKFLPKRLVVKITKALTV